MIDRAGDMQVTSCFRISCVGVSVLVLMGKEQILHWYLGLGHLVFFSNFPDFDSCGE